MATRFKYLFFVAVWLMLACSRSKAAQSPLLPAQTIQSFTLPPGFKASVFAAEPDVVQPISFCLDDRGRLWVAENLSYPNWKPDGHDRIIILDDPGNTGHFTRKTVFYDKLNYVTGLEVGFGGVFVVSAPNLLFIPDKNHDDIPDAEPEILLNGFGHEGVHNLVNGLIWGPDGWLWGGHGGSSSGYIGPPTASPPPPDAPHTSSAGLNEPPRMFAVPKTPGRTFYDGGVWRYHPTKRIFESVMEGTTNPWGLDFDDLGQAFISNSVTPHLYHVIPGGHVLRRRQSPLSQYAFEVMPPAADHLHYVGGDWAKSRGATEQQLAVGGGHAHCGLLCYLGDQFPDEYRGRLFMVNIHGARVNTDLPARKGSGYTASHGPDFLVASDAYFRGLHLKLAPDGSVYLSDWYDTGECHTRKPDQTNGRIYRITYEKPAVASPARHRLGADLSELNSAELVELQLSKNDWFVRHSRRILQERGDDADTKRRLLAILNDNSDITRKLRALWSLHAIGDLPRQLTFSLLKSPDENLRAWAIRFAAEDGLVTTEIAKLFEILAESDPSPFVRLHLASAAQRLPTELRWPLLQHLAAYSEDIDDANLPLMYWYALEPLVMADTTRAVQFAAKSKIPKLREFITRRLAAATK